MASKMSMLRTEDSIVGFNKKVVNYTDDYDSEDDYENENENNFYDHYEPYEEDFDDGEYQPFDPEEEEKEYIKTTSPNIIKKIKPCILLNSPTKSAEKLLKTSQSPTWWDKNKPIAESERIINGVLNWAALLPPPTSKPKTEIIPQLQPKKFKKNKKINQGLKEGDKKIQEKSDKKTFKKQQSITTVTTLEVQKPTRFCLSVIKKSKCFHGAQCRFAHDYSDLKECNFGEKCKKINVVKINPDGTLELINKNEVGCNFKHAKESKTSYLKRVPHQHTSPKK